jgi:hypothetical protein
MSGFLTRSPIGGALTGLLGTGMTFAGPALSALGDVIPAWIRQGRSIGDIIPDVTMEEQHSDRLQVTQHPLADNTPISDHAFRMPATLTMRCGWSNSNIVGALVGAFTSGTSPFAAFTETRAQEVYEKLRALQGTPDGPPVKRITIQTGKRKYENMVLTELSVTTDHTKEYSLFVEAHFQEVITVTTRTTTQDASSAEMADASKTGNTESTDSPQAKPEPKKPSMFDQITGTKPQHHRVALPPGQIETRAARPSYAFI